MMKEFNILGKKYVVISGENYKSLIDLLDESLNLSNIALDKCLSVSYKEIHRNRYLTNKDFEDLWEAADKISMMRVRMKRAMDLEALE